MNFQPEDIAQIKSANPIENYIGRKTKLSRANKKGFCTGECLCSPKKGKQPLWVDTHKQRWGCFKGGCKGDVFSYLEQFEGIDFVSGLKLLGGEKVSVDPALAEKMAAERARKIEAQNKLQAKHDEDERRKAYEIWQRGVAPQGTIVESYLKKRGLRLPQEQSLRMSMEDYYIVGEDDLPQKIYTGACMLAAIQGADGKFLGVHRTWIDLDTPNGKARITAPDGTPIKNTKKMRGQKKGGAIRLKSRKYGDNGKAILLIGEGVETTLSALIALEEHGRPENNYYAWAAGDLGNISGGTIGAGTKHPNRCGTIPSAEPDMGDPGITPPAWAQEIIILGDGDSDPYVTAARVECGAKRFRKMGFAATVRFAPAGMDFNDLLKAGAA